MKPKLRSSNYILTKTEYPGNKYTLSPLSWRLGGKLGWPFTYVDAKMTCQVWSGQLRESGAVSLLQDRSTSALHSLTQLGKACVQQCWAITQIPHCQIIRLSIIKKQLKLSCQNIRNKHDTLRHVYHKSPIAHPKWPPTQHSQLETAAFHGRRRICCGIHAVRGGVHPHHKCHALNQLMGLLGLALAHRLSWCSW